MWFYRMTDTQPAADHNLGVSLELVSCSETHACRLFHIDKLSLDGIRLSVRLSRSINNINSVGVPKICVVLLKLAWASSDLGLSSDAGLLRR